MFPTPFLSVHSLQSTAPTFMIPIIFFFLSQQHNALHCQLGLTLESEGTASPKCLKTELFLYAASEPVTLDSHP